MYNVLHFLYVTPRVSAINWTSASGVRTCDFLNAEDFSTQEYKCCAAHQNSSQGSEGTISNVWFQSSRAQGSDIVPPTPQFLLRRPAKLKQKTRRLERLTCTDVLIPS